MRLVPLLAPLVLAGCVSHALGTEAVADQAVPFASYAGCDPAWTSKAYAADCIDPHDSLAYRWADSVGDRIPAWRCIAGSDQVGRSVAWWGLYIRSPPDNLAGPLSDRVQLGFGYELREPTPLEGAFAITSQAGDPIIRWNSTGATGFVGLGQVPRHGELTFQASLLKTDFDEGPIQYEPTDYWPEGPFGLPATFRDFEPYDRVEAVNVSVANLQTAWGLHPRAPGGFPVLAPTRVVEVNGARRFFPSMELPELVDQDPRSASGGDPGMSGAYSSVGDFLQWTNLTEQGAAVRVHQHQPLRVLGYLSNLSSAHCGACPDLGSGLDGLTCLPVGPPAYRTSSPRPPNVEVPVPA